ncbi:PadR family transcriptional regulator [Streptomyces morookaense]|uniref:PadR family transcriptional regulator n=1 Tax=Streptomyces morookaense TaxID=1970 RepID=UPI0033EBEA32
MSRLELSCDTPSLVALCFLGERDMHPYEMLRLLHERHKEKMVRGLPRSIYRAVERLCGAGLVEPVGTTRSGRRPERTVYRITEDGREVMVAELAARTSTPDSELPSFAATLSLIGSLPDELLAPALRDRCIRLEGALADLGKQADLAAPYVARDRLVELHYLQAVRSAELSWVKSLLAEVGSRTANTAVECF